MIHGEHEWYGMPPKAASGPPDGLMMCSACPRAYHPTCLGQSDPEWAHVAPIKALRLSLELWPEDRWICPCCAQAYASEPGRALPIPEYQVR